MIKKRSSININSFRIKQTKMKIIFTISEVIKTFKFSKDTMNSTVKDNNVCQTIGAKVVQ